MLQLDVSSDASVRATIAEVVGRAGPIDVLVNNAGFGLFGAIEETSLEEARGQFETTFWGAVRLIEQVLPSMRERRSGRIVNVSSVLGFMPVPFQAFYVASKHALEGYSEVLNLEVRPFGIFVSLIEPSFIRTGFFEHRQEAKRRSRLQKQRARVSPMMRERTDTGSDPDMVAGVILKAISAIRSGGALSRRFQRRHAASNAQLRAGLHLRSRAAQVVRPGRELGSARRQPEADLSVSSSFRMTNPVGVAFSGALALPSVSSAIEFSTTLEFFSPIKGDF